MSGWTDELHTAAEQMLDGFVAEFADAMTGWQSAAAAGNTDQGQARVDDVLRRWREFTGSLQTGSLLAATNGTVMERLTSRLAEVSELRDTLAGLEARAGTRTEQSDSVNPKIRPSPYVNILGLQRTFREGTRNGLLIASIVIGVVALAVLGLLIWQFVSGSGLGALVSGNYKAAGTSFETFAQPYKSA